MDYIDYNISRNYLSHWTLDNALREIMQNFMDYGNYKIRTNENIVVFNNYEPEDLSFLTIGISKKENKESIGKYGEGLKMALMILTREDYKCSIETNGYFIQPLFRKNETTGEGFSIAIKKSKTKGFVFRCNLDKKLFNDFYENKIVKPNEVIFTANPYGSIVNKRKGDIFCGGLFVANFKKLTKSYNFNPSQLKLDRDRQTAQAFDVNWASSYINSAQGKIEAKELDYNENEYIPVINDSLAKKFEPIVVGDSIKFTYKDYDGKNKILKNSNAERILKNKSWFSEAISKIKTVIASKLGIYELLLEFQKKHVNNSEAEKDFSIILNRFKNNKND